MTLGMRLDQFLSRCQALSSIELYMCTVTMMALAALIVLYPAGVSSPPEESTAAASQRTTKKTTTTKVRPAWHGPLRLVNFLLLAGFLASLVAFFTLDPGSTRIRSRYLLGWSLYLVYFFSFCGISILYDVSMDDPEPFAAALPPKPRYVECFLGAGGGCYALESLCLTLSL